MFSEPDTFVPDRSGLLGAVYLCAPTIHSQLDDIVLAASYSMHIRNFGICGEFWDPYGNVHGQYANENFDVYMPELHRCTPPREIPQHAISLFGGYIFYGTDLRMKIGMFRGCRDGAFAAFYGLGLLRFCRQDKKGKWYSDLDMLRDYWATHRKENDEIGFYTGKKFPRLP